MRFFSIKIIFSLITTVIIGVIGLNTGVFWDNVLFISQMGDALYHHGILSWGSIPVEHDPGHPPFVASIMVLFWYIFGKSLLVSHLILWPFIFGIVWQLYNLCSFFIKSKELCFLSVLFLLIDTTILAHVISIDIEVPLLFFCLYAVNSILLCHDKQKCLALVFLSMVSLRGMMLCFGLFLFDLWFHKQYITTLKIYFIASIPSLLFVFWRLYDKGWIISNPLHIWGDSLSFISFSDFIKNMGWNLIVIIHRYLDFGRFIPILFILFTFIYKRETLKNREVRILIALSVLSVSIILFSCIILKNAIGHRYFLISFISIELLALILVEYYRKRILLFSVMILSLISGSFYVYPDKISELWDSTMAHYPYWELRSQALNYMDNHHIEIANTASFYPNLSIDEVELNNDPRHFQYFDGSNKYVLFSNVMIYSEEDYDILMDKYYLIKKYQSRGVRVEIRKMKAGVELNTSFDNSK